MASIAYNIEQITHFDIQNLPSIEKNGMEYAKHIFQKITVNSDGTIDKDPYLVNKLGYCCEPKGIGSWIYLYLENQNQAIPIQIGKSGMFEIQPETYKQLNSDDGTNEQVDMKIKIAAIELPKDIKFTLDFAYNI